MAGSPAPAATSPRPNLLLIVADDMGFSDLGSFGGEIATPNLDELALGGVRLTNFQAAPMCSPSRAMLLTGVDPHKAGFGNMLEELSPNQQGQPGYEGYLTDNVVTVATLLRDAGYRTYLSGKWHLSRKGRSLASDRGFERTFALNSGGASHFADMRPAYAPSPDIKADYVQDGQQLTALPDTFEYSSQFYADQMIRYLGDGGEGDAPFFALLSFTAPHWPLQAPRDAITRYAGRYNAGYDELLAERLARMKTLGLVPENHVPVPRPPKGQPWSTLSDEQRAVEARAMEVYAAMIDEMDRHTGRVLDHLRSTGRLDNTVVVFLSDNGAEGHDLDETWPGDLFPKIRQTIDESFDFSFAAMGHPGSYTLYGPNWARAAAPTFRLHKGFPTEGGTRTAAFAYYPQAFPAGRISDALVSIKDIPVTLLTLAGVEAPAGEYAGREVEPMTGTSIVPLLTADTSQLPERTLGLELMGKRAIRQGPWKLVHMPPPYGSDEWQLFDLTSDPGETRDLAAARPEVLTRMKSLWEVYATENGVIIPDWVSGY
ncbi:MAG: arylsulfatase [Pseudomonadota bacterium]